MADTPDVAFSAAKLAVQSIDWTMDARNVPDRCYEEIRRILLDTFPEATIRLIVRRYFMGTDRAPYSLGFATVRIRNDRYLGSPMLSAADARSAETAIANALVEQLRPQVRNLLAIYRADPGAQEEEDVAT